MAILTAAVLGGVTSLVRGVPPQSVLSTMSPLVQELWQYELLAGGVIGLVGVWWPGTLAASLKVERIGVGVLGAATSMYAIAIAVAAGLAGVVAGSFVIAIALSCWARTFQITRDIARAVKATREGCTTDVTLLAEKR
ncbi:MAG: hypothetical protein JF597_00695 [Streptomyces sp.]|uniref:hypothetical protein n=1 Tax=Streptomyces sp. TaxID=1931 RepID=UPI0025DCB35F|nr:hypothetical protein [Streptomyces sp.]MBW8792156.1 hypothetical protein [Streptomyces sp.]